MSKKIYKKTALFSQLLTSKLPYTDKGNFVTVSDSTYKELTGK